MAPKPPKGKIKGKGKEISKGGETEKRTNASWNDVLVKTLLNVCRDYQKIHGPDQQFKWPDIAKSFQEVSKKPYSQDTIKNKYDYTKRIWQNWNDLRDKETGCGWDYTTGRVTATDEWWENKLKESDKYKRFRKHGVDPATSELWDQVFGFVGATENNCVSPSMEPDYQTALAIRPSHNPQVSNTNNDTAGYEETGHSDVSLIDMDQSLIEQVNQDTMNNFLGHEFLDQVHQIVTGVGTNSCPLPQRPVGNQTPSSSLDCNRVKKKSRSTPFIERFDRMEARGEKILALFQEEINSSSVKGDSSTNLYEQLDAMIALKDLINEGLVEEGSDMWCFALSELRKPESCIAFLSFEKNQMRLKWLQYEFKMHNARMGFN